MVIPLPGLRNTDFIPKAELSFGHADFEFYYEISKGRYMVGMLKIIMTWSSGESSKM